MTVLKIVAMVLMSLKADGDGTVDNWFDCMGGSNVSMELVNDGTENCPDGDDGHDDHDDHSGHEDEVFVTTLK